MNSIPLTDLAHDASRVACWDEVFTNRKSGSLIFVLLLSVVALFGTKPVLATVTIDSVELVEETRVGRTTFNYTYRVTATNNSPVTAVNATAYLSLPPPTLTVGETPTIPKGVQDLGAPMVPFMPAIGAGQSGLSGTTLLDDIVTLGDIGPGASVTSTDTYTIQQDRTIPFDASGLIWEVGYVATLRLSGEVKDQPIPHAEVVVVVDRTDSGRPIIESGRPIIESFTTTADEAGRYTVDIEFVADADFVTIKGTGVDVLAFVDLTSIAGSAGSLLELSTESSSEGGNLLQLDSVDHNPLDVTHISTALATLAIQANNGAGFTNDEALAIAQAQVDTRELITMAAVIKTVVDNANIPLPPGFNTTQELLNNPGAFIAYLASLQESFPDEFEAAFNETVIDISNGYTVNTMPQTLYLSYSRGIPLLNGGNAFTFETNGSATHIGGSGETTDAQWVLDDGDIVVSLNNPPVIESFPSREVPPKSGNYEQVLRLDSITEFRIVRISVGLDTDLVLLGSTSFATYPNHTGVLPDEVTVSAPNPEFGYLAFDQDGIFPFEPADVSGQTIAVPYAHTTNDNQALNVSEFAADLLQFNVNGTGATTRQNLTFDWSLDNFGRLVIDFANGDQTVFARYAQPQAGTVDLGVAVGRYDDGLAKAMDVQAVTRVVETQFDVQTLVNQKFRSLSFIAATENFGNIFDFNFYGGGEGCRVLGNYGLTDFNWSVNPQGYMQLERYDLNGDLNRKRDWQAISVLPGVLGDRYHVIENLEYSFSPGFPNDATQVPGRMNAYEHIMDISNNTAPTAVDDVASTVVDTSVVIDVLANDFDAEGNRLIFLNWTQPTQGGSISEEYDDTGYRIIGLRYTPPAGVTDFVDTFTYSISDDVCYYAPAPATVSVTVGTPVDPYFVNYSWTGFVEPGSPKDPNPWDISGDGEVGTVNNDGTPYEITVTVYSDDPDMENGVGGQAAFPVSNVELTIDGDTATVTNAQLRFQDNNDSDWVFFVGDVERFGTTIPFVFTLVILNQSTFTLSPTPAQDPVPVFDSTSTISQGALFGPVITTSLPGTPVVVEIVEIGVGGSREELPRLNKSAIKHANDQANDRVRNVLR